MVLYLVGLGLGDEQDITLRGLQIVRGCKRIYLEAYTAVLMDAYQNVKPQEGSAEDAAAAGELPIVRLKRNMAQLYNCQPEDIVEVRWRLLV